MSKFRKAGYIFKTWIGDHFPKHVHVFKDSRLVLKWDLENSKAIEGKSNSAILKAIRQLRAEGKL